MGSQTKLISTEAVDAIYHLYLSMVFYPYNRPLDIYIK
jgi:hypothetical protein